MVNPDTFVFVPDLWFALVMTLWASAFTETWKRREKTLAMKWGMVNYTNVERGRPQFIGETISSPVDGG